MRQSLSSLHSCMLNKKDNGRMALELDRSTVAKEGLDWLTFEFHYVELGVQGRYDSFVREIGDY
jgi:hypothetical protein